jgi:hypothetical protein
MLNGWEPTLFLGNRKVTVPKKPVFDGSTIPQMVSGNGYMPKSNSV